VRSISKTAINGRKKRQTELAGARVTVYAEPDNQLDSWLRELRRSRAEVGSFWPPPKRFSPGMDILICDFFPQIAEFIPWEPGDTAAALVLLLPRNGHFEEHAIAAATPHGVVSRSSSSSDFLATVFVAWSQFRYEKRLRDRISRLDENLRSVRLVEKAKLILMGERDLTEAAAYRFLRDQAMRRRVSVVEFSDAIVSKTTAIY
jgi:AmiR/NasT family two-component response regulator